jgi:4-hydroxy 2-oxovalerate aldolase
MRNLYVPFHDRRIKWQREHQDRLNMKNKSQKKGKSVTELKSKNNHISASGRWVSYRSDIKVLDCTIRDGGLMNNHHFSDNVVKVVYEACVAAGIDYMELGYKADDKIFSKDEYGTWKHCDEEDIRRIVGDNKTELKLSVMADAERTDYHRDILPKDQSVIDMIRVATYIHQIPTALDIARDAHEKGYETTLNIMAVSTVPEHELDSALELVCKSSIQAIYLVDSFGAFYSEQIRYMFKKYLKYAQPAGITVGMHAHNNQMLAYANTIEAIILGANMVDASMAGLGRGAGNCAMELILGFLHNPKYKLRPVLDCIQTHIEPMREKLLWGFDIPYMITGLLNQHPRDAIKFNSSDDRGNFTKFFDDIVSDY